MAKWNIGSKNGNWKGGRTIASNGYALIKVNKNHHLADTRGYAYEHRIVAEKVLGRELRPGELVHHKDGDKLNNSPDNLTILSGHAEHRKFHPPHNKRKDNPVVECECGCGTHFLKYRNGVGRRYVFGHNLKDAPRTVRLPDEVVREIRELAQTKNMKQWEIGLRYGISQSHVCRIAQGTARKKEWGQQ